MHLILTFVPCIFYYMYNEQTNAHLIDSLFYCSLFITPTCFNTNASSLRMSFKCAFVCSLYINACVFTGTVMKPFQLIPVFLIIRLVAMNCHLQASQQILPIRQLTQGFQTPLLLFHRPIFHSTLSRVWNHQMQLRLPSNHWRHTLVVTLMMMLAPVLVHRSVLGVTLVLSLLMRIKCQLM